MSGIRTRSCAVIATLAIAGGMISLGTRTEAQRESRRQTLYVATNGTSTNDGSSARPLSLVRALSVNGPVRPGDTVFLRRGTYRGNFTSHLTGTPSLPIIVRAYPGERVTLDGAASPAEATLLVRGSDTTYWGFEITNSDPRRAGGVASRGTGVDIYGPRTKFVNLVIHDVQTGIGSWSTAIDSELYGNIVYNNGVDSSDRGHGHSIYAQNRIGTKRIADNILFNSFSHGIHIYTEEGFIDNFVLDGNVVFNHGILSQVSGPQRDILVGGRRTAHNLNIVNNFLYDSPGRRGGGAEFGHTLPCSKITIAHNYFVSARPIIVNCRGVTFTDNDIYGDVDETLAANYPANRLREVTPTRARSFVRPNRYDSTRAHVIVYNWPLQDTVEVDLRPTGWKSGTRVQVFDAERLMAGPLFTATYDGTTLMIPMTGLTAEPPIGGPARAATHTAPGFGVFVVVSTAATDARGRPRVR
jgi:hypothetical protein